MISEEELERLRVIASKATPRPWRGDCYDGSIKYSIFGADDTEVLSVNHKNADYGFIGPNGQADELFVLEMANASDTMLAEIERLREALGWIADASDVAPNWQDFPGVQALHVHAVTALKGGE